MIWVRKGVILLLSLFLLVSLVGTAFSTSFNRTLGKPQKVETYLYESHLYDHFVTYVADQAAKSEGDNQAGSVSLSDAAVQAAARTSFPSELIQKGVNGFINANYGWLEGRTSIPQFKLDLSAQKEAFAKRVGQVVKAYAATLPVCTAVQAKQLAQQQNTDPLSATCRVAGVSPASIGAQVTERLSDTGDFLSNPVITASSVNPKGNLQSHPYFIKLSKLPKAYRIATKLPYIFSGLSILLALSVIFISFTRRKGVRIVGIVMAVAGVVLVASKFIADHAVKRIENHIFSNSDVGPLQQSLTDFAHRVESSLARTNLRFGIAFLVLALLILVILLSTRSRKSRPKRGGDELSKPETNEDRRLPLLIPRKGLRRSSGDSIMPLGAKPGGNEPKRQQTMPTAAGTPGSEPGPEPGSDIHPRTPPKRKKRPRLIQ